jgi:hypothetical protein
LTGPGEGSVAGIRQPPEFTGLKVRNGFVTGWAEAGIFAEGSAAKIDNVHASANGSGILVGTSGILSECTAVSNIMLGLGAIGNVTIRDCAAESNTEAGILVFGNAVIRDPGSHCATQ